MIFLFQPIDSKREEFRKYLERAGVMDALTKVLVMLYEEVDKPQDALEYPFAYDSSCSIRKAYFHAYYMFYFSVLQGLC